MSRAICIASGWSLTQADVDYCRGKGKVFAVNDVYKMAPWADALYACDEKWWEVHQGVQSFQGEKYTISTEAAAKWGLNNLGFRTDEALCLEKGTVATGKNSGYQCINLAVHGDVDEIILLGYNMCDEPDTKRSHFFGEHPSPLVQSRNYAGWVAEYEKLASALQSLGIKITNCTPHTALTCFEQKPLREVL